MHPQSAVNEISELLDLALRETECKPSVQIAELSCSGSLN
jgi:hypothetical protein